MPNSTETRRRYAYRKTWTPMTKVVYAEEVEREEPVVPHSVDTIPFCPCCSADFTGMIYGAYWHGQMRWQFLCSACAAEWIRHGGNVTIRLAW